MTQTKLFIGLLTIILIACSNEENNYSPVLRGKVINYITDKCACCPGWQVEYGGDTLKFENVPENETLMDLVDYYGYPISIDFTFEDNKSVCSEFYKDMTSIEFNVNENCSISGLIIDYNNTECACCPGWIIVAGTDTIKVYDIPFESIVREKVETAGYPIQIELDYQDIDDYCAGLYKQITCMHLID